MAMILVASVIDSSEAYNAQQKIWHMPDMAGQDHGKRRLY